MRKDVIDVSTWEEGRQVTELQAELATELDKGKRVILIEKGLDI